MRARVPGSTSNLGPGFDALGLALNRYLEVEVREQDHLELVCEGEGSDLAADASHLAVRVATQVLGHDRVFIAVRSEIPLGRGLGSSAALALATAAAAGASDPFAIAAAFDGHAENAAASNFGGLVTAAMVDGAPIARRLPLDASLRFVALIPNVELATKTARSVLPAQVPFRDAVFNLGRMGLLLAGLGDASQLTAEAGADRLHQDARTELFRPARELIATLRSAGATVACWSGAGPTMLGICEDDHVAETVRDAGERALSDLGLGDHAVVLQADHEGLVLSD